MRGVSQARDDVVMAEGYLAQLDIALAPALTKLIAHRRGTSPTRMKQQKGRGLLMSAGAQNCWTYRCPRGRRRGPLMEGTSRHWVPSYPRHPRTHASHAHLRACTHVRADHAQHTHFTHTTHAAHAHQAPTTRADTRAPHKHRRPTKAPSRTAHAPRSRRVRTHAALSLQHSRTPIPLPRPA